MAARSFESMLYVTNIKVYNVHWQISKWISLIVQVPGPRELVWIPGGSRKIYQYTLLVSRNIVLLKRGD